MVAWFLGYTTEVAPMVEGDDAASVGAAIGVGLSWMVILFFWVGGTTIILGLFVLLTRRTRALVPDSQHSKTW